MDATAGSPEYVDIDSSRICPQNMWTLTSSSRTQNTTSYYDQSRQRLRPWLEAKINSGTIPGLVWVDPDQTIFKVPWKRGGKQDWSPSDSMLFEEWAKHTGRYREGIDTPEYATWKTRLRCAFNKAPDIQEVKEMSKLDDIEPYRVYKLLPRRESSRQQHHPVPMVTANSPASSAASPQSDISVQSPMQVMGSVPVPLVIEKLDSEIGQLGSLDADLKGIPSGEFVYKNQPDLAVPSLEGVMTYNKDEPMDFCEGPSAQTIIDTVIEETTVYPSNPYTGAPSIPQIAPSPQFTTVPDDHEMFLQIQYKSTVVLENHIKNTHGCRIFYGSSSKFREEQGPDIQVMEEVMQNLYGPETADQIQFPVSVGLFQSQKQESVTKQLFGHTVRGVLIHCDNSGIFVTRLCRCMVFYASPDTNGESRKLERGKAERVFDYKQFMNSVCDYVKAGQEAPKPKVDVQIGFGQRWSAGQSNHDVLITARVRSSKAYLIRKVVQQQVTNSSSSLDSSLKISSADDMDQLAESIEKFCLDTGVQQGF